MLAQLMTKEAPAHAGEGSSELNEQLKRTVEELNRVMEAKEEISQRCHELDLQVLLCELSMWVTVSVTIVVDELKKKHFSQVPVEFRQGHITILIDQ